MNAKELKAQYEDALRERLKELGAEREMINNLLTVSSGGHERATADDRPARKKTTWTAKRRAEQSRRLKAYHRNKR